MRTDTTATALIVAWVAALAAGIALAVAVAGEGPIWRELEITQEVQEWTFPGERLSDAVRSLTETWLVVLLGTLLSIGLFVTGHRREAMVLLALMFVLPLAQAGLKNVVDRPRPTPELVEVRGAIGSESFPAGHVMSPTVLYVFVLWLCYARREWPVALRAVVAAFAVAILALTGLVNVWLGVHWLFDVLGGYAWGLALGLPAVLLAREGAPIPGI